MGWRIEKGSLDDIARDVFNSKHGSFLRAMADAWLRADVENKEILRPAWVEIIRNHDLDKETE